MRTLRFAAALAGLSAAPAMVTAQQPQTPLSGVQVVVFPLSGFVMGDDAKQLPEVFRSMIITEMANAGTRMVERQEVDRLLEAQALSLSGTVPDAQAIRIGELLGAQYMVTGSISIVGREARLDLRIVDIETSEMVPPPFKETVPVDKLLSIVNRVATEFAAKAQVKARVEDIVVPAPAVLAYARGVAYEKSGNKREAAQWYRRTLELFPQHPHARAALQRMN
ncbi:MAG TPA: CsgG/HfaB family protein [Longimicrobiales bacterium]|nr:CsgG/HfaB family protein [Longimicrobiales bacterium]